MPHPDAESTELLLSVIIPVYNECPTIEQVIRSVLAVDLKKEIIVVDDGSTDGTGERLRGLAQTVAFRLIVHEKNRGKGAAIRSGVASTRGALIIIQDADLEYDPNEYPKLVRPILEGKADVVFGSRFRGETGRVLYFWHSVGNRLLTLISNILTDLNLSDMETGYKVFKRSVLSAIRLTSERFGFEPEVTAKVARMGCVVYEVPISYSGRTYREGKKIGWRDGLAALWHLLRYNLLTSEAAAFAVQSPHWTFLVSPPQIPKIGGETLDLFAENPGYNDYLLRQIVPCLSGDLLEVGSGIGNLSIGLVADKRLTSVTLSDIDVTYLERLRARVGKTIRVIACDLERPASSDLNQLQFDSILCCNVLEHIVNDQACLQWLGERLRPGGRLMLLVPAHQALYGSLDRGLLHVRRYRCSGLKQQIRDAQLQLESMRFLNPLAGLGWWVHARLLQSKRLPRSGVGLMSRLALLLPWIDQVNPFPFGLSIFALIRKADIVDPEN